MKFHGWTRYNQWAAGTPKVEPAQTVKLRIVPVPETLNIGCFTCGQRSVQMVETLVNQHIAHAEGQCERHAQPEG